ncbi:MAG TPA: hemerythrin domain-containing protein [Terriglobia bacterium]|nr:hemerythrin domain-containing protein [Terriglobia bacterium]
MARRGKGSSVLKWSLIGSGIAAGAALIPLVPALKKRAMRVTTILTKDHRLVSGMIKTLEMTPRINGMLRKTIFEQIRTNVMVHAQAEEEVLYPAMRNIMYVGGESKVDEAYREHQQVKDLLNDLETMDPNTDAFDTKFADFRNKIEHHVDEEENEMFVMLKQRMSTERQEELGQRIHDRKMSLKTKMAA